MLLIEISEGRIRIKFSDISYLESMGHETFIHTDGGRVYDPKLGRSNGIAEMIGGRDHAGGV